MKNSRQTSDFERAKELLRSHGLHDRLLKRFTSAERANVPEYVLVMVLYVQEVSKEHCSPATER